MIFSMQNLSICCYWYDRPVTGGQFLDQVRQFVEKVQHAFPTLSNLRVVRDPAESDGFIEKDFSNFDREVVASLPKDWVYINNDPKHKDFSRDCRASISFRAAFTFGSSDMATSFFVQVSIGSNGRSGDSLILHIAPELETEEIAKRLFDISVSFWTPHHAVVTRSEVDALLKQPIGDVRIGWLTYFSDKNVLKYLPECAFAEKFKSGVLVEVSGSDLSASDKEGVECMREIIKSLEPIGLLKNPKRAK